MTDPENRDATYGLVMPFVTTADHGGPHDPQSYVCGYEMGHLDSRLEHQQPKQHQQPIHSVNTTQAELIAMRHGYRCQITQEPEHPEWSLATFQRVEEQA